MGECGGVGGGFEVEDRVPHNTSWSSIFAHRRASSWGTKFMLLGGIVQNPQNSPILGPKTTKSILYPPTPHPASCKEKTSEQYEMLLAQFLEHGI